MPPTEMATPERISPRYTKSEHTGQTKMHPSKLLHRGTDFMDGWTHGTSLGSSEPFLDGKKWFPKNN
jgi:hypothetical protein